MAVRLILVALVVASLALASAQQSEETGGRAAIKDRRLNIRRFSARRKAEGESAGSRRKGGGTPEELERRRELFRRNRVNRKRPVSNTEEREEPAKAVEAPTSRRIRPRPSPRVRPDNDIDAPVVRISNSDRDIQNLVLRGGEEEEERVPFKGISEVGEVSPPSGFHSPNEQIVRVSFKRPAPAQPAPRKPISAKNAALEALLRTVAKKQETATESNFVDEPLSSDEKKSAVREMKEDDREAEALAARKKLRVEEQEGGQRQRFRSFPNRQGGGRAVPRRRPQGGESSGARRDRVRTRGRAQARTTAEPITRQEEELTTLAPRTSFPAPTTAPQQLAQEAPRSAFTLDQSFGNFFTQAELTATPAPARAPAPAPAPAPARAPLPAPVPAQRFPQRIAPAQPTQQQTFQPQQFQPQPAQQQFQQPAAPAAQPFPTLQQFVQQQQQVQQQRQPQPAQQQQFQPQAVQQQFQPRPVQLQQSAPAAQQPRTALQPFQPQQPAAAQSSIFGANPFNLINSGNNFQAFDSQFGGSVPQTPGAAQLSSSIFSGQPQQRLQPQQVQPQQRLQPQPVAQQRFQPQQPQRQQAFTAFTAFAPSQQQQQQHQPNLSVFG